MNSNKPKTTLLSILIRSTALTSLVSLMAAAANAQGNWAPKAPAIYILVPGTLQAIPAAYETIGMRQERAAFAANRHANQVARPGMSPAWFGVATALDTMAAMGAVDRVLASDHVVTLMRSEPLSERELRVDRMRLQASDNSIDLLQARSVQFSGDTQAELLAAMKEMQVRRVRLELSMTAAENALPNVPETTRAAAADDYSRYSEAAARVEHLESI